MLRGRQRTLQSTGHVSTGRVAEDTRERKGDCQRTPEVSTQRVPQKLPLLCVAATVLSDGHYGVFTPAETATETDKIGFYDIVRKC